MKNQTIKSTYWKTFPDMLEYVTSTPRSDDVHNKESQTRGNAKWYGTASFEDCLALCQDSWPEGRKKVEFYTKQYSAIWSKFFPQQDFGITTEKVESGGIVLVEDYLAGQPDCMLDFHPDYEKQDKASGQKLQRIIINAAVSCYINIETIYMQGSLIAALVNSMELSGFNVELIITWQLNEYVKGKEVGLRYALTVKSFQQHIDLDRLAFAIAHPSMFRRLIFSAMESEPDDIAAGFCNSVYGFPTDLDAESISRYGVEIGELLKHGNMYFRILRGNYSEAQLVEQCTAVVKGHFTEITFNTKDADESWDKYKGSIPPSTN